MEYSITKTLNPSEMWAGVGRRIVTTVVRGVLSARHYTVCATQQPQGLDWKAEEVKEFLSWLDRRGAMGECTAVSIGMSQYGRALIALRQVRAGGRLLEVSRNLIITPDKIPQEVADLLTTDNDKTRLSLFLLAERHKGQASAWAPYIQSLPPLGDIHSTIFWKEEELTWLTQSAAYLETIERLKVITAEFGALQNVLLAYPDSFGNVSLIDFMHAYATVTSRSWGVCEGVSTVSMVPFADFFNHDHNCRTLLSYDKHKNCAVAIADRDYAAGDEVLLCYGYSPNAFLAVDYGFAPPYNPYEQAQIWVEIPRTDPLHETKLEVLSRHNMRIKVNEDSCGRSFVIREANATSTIFPDSLCAFARVICASSCEDLDEMTKDSLENDDFYARRPRTDTAKEAQAMAFILANVERQIDKHVRALQALRTELVSVRKGIAQNVLSGELRVLKAASAWLKKDSRI